MENYAYIEGKKVNLSDETVKELKKALIPEDPKIKLGETVWSHCLGESTPLTLIQVDPNRYQLLSNNCRTWAWSDRNIIWYKSMIKGIPLSVIQKTYPDVEYRG
jgi:hypothetical protein